MHGQSLGLISLLVDLLRFHPRAGTLKKRDYSEDTQHGENTVLGKRDRTEVYRTPLGLGISPMVHYLEESNLMTKFPMIHSTKRTEGGGRDRLGAVEILVW